MAIVTPHISETVRPRDKRSNNSNNVLVDKIILQGLVKTGSSLLLQLNLVFFDVPSIGNKHMCMLMVSR